jgi:hypothetical protein
MLFRAALSSFVNVFPHSGQTNSPLLGAIWVLHSRWSYRPTPNSRNFRMIRIAISPAAFEGIAAFPRSCGRSSMTGGNRRAKFLTLIQAAHARIGKVFLLSPNSLTPSIPAAIDFRRPHERVGKFVADARRKVRCGAVVPICMNGRRQHDADPDEIDNYDDGN